MEGLVEGQLDTTRKPEQTKHQFNMYVELCNCAYGYTSVVTVHTKCYGQHTSLCQASWQSAGLPVLLVMVVQKTPQTWEGWMRDWSCCYWAQDYSEMGRWALYRTQSQ